MNASYTIDHKGQLKRAFSDKMDSIGDGDSGKNIYLFELKI